MTAVLLLLLALVAAPSADCALAPTYQELATRQVTWATWPKFLADIQAVNGQHTTRHMKLPPGYSGTTEAMFQDRVKFLQHMALTRIKMMNCGSTN